MFLEVFWIIRRSNNNNQIDRPDDIDIFIDNGANLSLDSITSYGDSVGFFGNLDSDSREPVFIRLIMDNEPFGFDGWGAMNNFGKLLAFENSVFFLHGERKLVSDFLSAFGSSSSKDGPAVVGLHSCAETGFVAVFLLRWLVSFFHNKSSEVNLRAE